ALGGDHAAVADGFEDVVKRGGIGGAYHVALCLAATMVGDDLLGGGAALEFPGIDEASYDARWVARFVSAYVNADRPTGEALVTAAVADASSVPAWRRSPARRLRRFGDGWPDPTALVA